MQDTGLRPDEVLKMRWEHIDWLQKTASNLRQNRAGSSRGADQ